jgi:hypothetical protein
MDIVTQTYELAVEDARKQFGRDPNLVALLDSPIDRDELERFLICFSALGVQMTRPVEHWIARAGERCIDLGLPQLGAALKAHARHEADHHLMMIEDVRVLVERRNRRLGSDLSADALVTLPATPGVQSYAKLHEDVIAGPAPFAQLAIEYEIERLSVGFGGRFLRICVDRLGKDALRGMSFLEEHVALDVGHTKLNQAELGKLLAAHPGFVPDLAAAGRSALVAYASFLGDCFDLARKLEHAQPRPAFA